MQNSKFVTKKVGGRIKAARKDLFSRQGLCDVVNRLAADDNRDIALNEATLKQWEYGNNRIDIEWIPYLCRALNCDVGYLIGDYECRTREATDIRAQTGLSETAILNLKKNVGGYWDALNSVLENETFWQFLKLMETYKQTGAQDDMVGKYVKSSIEFATKKLLPDPERKDTDVFTDTFFQSVCNHYCWAIMEDYKKRNTDTGKEK